MIRRSLAWLTCYALSVGAFVLLTGCSTVPLEDRANNAAIADTASTVGALALGATELNPANWATIPVKLALLLYCKTLPEDEKAECHSAASAVWGGAAVNNVLVAAALLADIACGYVCLAAGVGYAIYDWRATAAERDFYAACAEAKRAWGMTEKCSFGS